MRSVGKIKNYTEFLCVKGILVMDQQYIFSSFDAFLKVRRIKNHLAYYQRFVVFFEETMKYIL